MKDDVKPLRPALSPIGLVFLAIASVGWGLNFPVMKLLLREWPPLSSRGLSGVVGALGLAALALAQRQALAVPKGMWPRLIAISLLTISSWVGCMGLALVWLSATEASILTISLPVWTALFAWALLGEKVSLLRAVALAFALSGIAILIGGGGVSADVGKLPGMVFALSGAILVGLGTVVTKRFPVALPPLAMAAWTIGIGCVPVAAVGLLIEDPRLSALSAIGWASMVYMTVVQFCLCYACWFATLARLPAATASIGTLLVPLIGVLSAAVMLQEPLGLREILALTVALGGIAVAMRS